jgi:ABC-type sugar transport system permease subunit
MVEFEKDGGTYRKYPIPEREIDLEIGALVIGVFSAISFIFLFTILMQPTRADWDFRKIFAILFITNIIYGIVIIGLIFKNIKNK